MREGGDVLGFSKLILKNAKTVKEGHWLIMGSITGNMSYDTEKHT